MPEYGQSRDAVAYQKYRDFAQPDAQRTNAPRWLKNGRIAGTALAAIAIVAALAYSCLPRFSPKPIGWDKKLSERCMEDVTVRISEASERLASLPFSLRVGEDAIREISPFVSLRWATVGRDLSVSVDTEAARSWALDDAAAQLTSAGSEHRYMRADGKEITVSGGDYGWIADLNPVADALVAHLTGQGEDSIEVPMTQTAATWAVHGRDWGNRYIDTDLTEQYARMYDEEGDLIWESPFVSGNVSEDRGTPEGVYVVNNHKGLNQELRGLDENHDGEPDYISHVTYWIPFIENLVAFHDATWRGYFGDNVYLYNGSHGCVNLPYYAAQELYDLAQVGDVVVVHW